MWEFAYAGLHAPFARVDPASIDDGQSIQALAFHPGPPEMPSTESLSRQSVRGGSIGRWGNGLNPSHQAWGGGGAIVHPPMADIVRAGWTNPGAAMACPACLDHVA